MRRKLLCLLFVLLALNLSGCTAWYAVEQWKCDTFGLCMPGYVPRCRGAQCAPGGYAPGGYGPYPAAPYGGYGGVVAP
jgi:hypothetical protein